MNYLLWALIAGASVAAAVALLELCARRLLRAHAFYSRYRPYSRVRLEIDTTALPALEKIVRVEANRDGERGDPPPERGERAWRALVVGGSVAECFYLDQQSTWPAVIQQVLSQPENLAALGVPRVHVGSAARPIVPCQQINMLLQRILPRYERLDAILVMVGASDVVSWLEKKAPRVIPDSPVPPSRLFEMHPEGPWGITPRKTALFRIAAELRHRLLGRVMVMKRAGDWLHRVRAMRASAKVRLDIAPDPTPMLASFEKHFRALLETAQAGAKRVIVVRQPWFDKAPTPAEDKTFWNFGVGRPYKDQVDIYYSPRAVSRLMRVVDARAEAIARELGVEQVNLMPSLEQSARTYYDDLHFTPEGARTVGRVVADAILRKAAASTEIEEEVSDAALAWQRSNRRSSGLGF